ncbi:MAG: CoA transferase [Myxococcota bacterium]|nr:CoA transferase [Myxococcota bacterium]
MASPSKNQGPCAGLRVLDFTTVVSGPICTQALGDLGADVIKVETLSGDMSRTTSGPFHAGLSGFFTQFNRNKRSMALDLKSESGRQVVKRLIGRCDVLVENFRPDVMDRLGIGWESLRSIHPDLVYVSISGFGPDGPYSPLPAYDHVVQGITGMMPVQGGAGAPQMFRSVVADKAAGLTALSAILAALLARERMSAPGQRIDVPMLDAYAGFMLGELMGPLSFPGQEVVPTPFDPFRVYPTADGHLVGMVVQDDQYVAVCQVLGREDLLEDARFCGFAARFQNYDDLAEVLTVAFRDELTEDLARKLREAGAPFAPVNDFESCLRDEQFRHNGVVEEIQDPEVSVRVLRPPARFSGTPVPPLRRPPLLGEHTDEILALCGFSPEEIRDLRDQAVVA